MTDFDFITPLDGGLLACVSLQEHAEQKDAWLMRIKLMYDGELAGTTEFNLQGYSQSEAEALARDLRKNDYLMREIDEFLWGESD